MPKRLRLSRRAGARLPPDAVVVARPSRWGNPFRIGDPGIPDRATAVSAYRAHIARDSALRAQARAQLRGKDLACWCPLDEACHADVLLEIANGDDAPSDRTSAQ